MRLLLVAKWILAVSGLFALASALFSYNASSNFLAEAYAAPGTVFDFLEDQSGGSISYRPIIKFVTEDGREVRFSTPTGSNPAAYSVGEGVTVLYAPGSPQDAKLNNFSSLSSSAVTLAVSGAILLLIVGLLTLVCRWKSHRLENNLTLAP